ncbi:MAG: type secretion system protein (GspF), partial [Armatimonadetes bacterium]|nr:type secretion system protein (GspF) [Armatimonadota bacterium]
MAEFSYTALDAQGREVNGSLQAEDRSSALSRLKSQGMYPMAIQAAVSAAARASAASAAAAAPAAAAPMAFMQRGVSLSDLALFTRQLASLFNAGLNMARCLDTLIEHCESRALAIALQQIRQAVQGGSALWEAMAEHPRIFSELYVSLVQAGETSGQLGNVLERLAVSLEIQQEQRSKVRSALAYPMLLMSAGFGAVLFILVFLVPRFAKIFKSLNRELPAPTQALLNIQFFVSNYGIYVFFGVLAIVFAVKAWERTEQGGLALDDLRMKVPVMGTITRKDAVARFCRTMATLVQGGVPILTSFEVAERAVGNRVLRRAVVQIRAAVREGEPLAEPMRRSGVFPSLVTNMVAVGEETGSLDQMLTRVADAYDAEVSNRLRQLISMVEPA